MEVLNKDLNMSNLNNFHSLEVVDRVSETQRQVGEIEYSRLLLLCTLSLVISKYID